MTEKKTDIEKEKKVSEKETRGRKKTMGVPPKERGCIPLNIIFYLKNGCVLTKRVNLEKGKFDEFQTNFLNTVTSERSYWYHLIEAQNPNKSSLFRLEDVSAIELEEMYV